MIDDVELVQIIFALGQDAYTGSIAREIRKKVGRDVHVGWLHMRLNRLKSLGLLKQEKQRTRANGSRPKAFVRLTPKGEEIGQLAAEPGRANASLRGVLDGTEAHRERKE
jgi:DNA-binding PadR family transcriptional regulator